ncbi:MAG: hypothetical protein U0871_12445 [Gemmataceae bacterium]
MRKSGVGGMFFLVVVTALLSSWSHADDCTTYDTPKNQPCTLNTPNNCDPKGIVYNDQGQPIGCAPNFRIIKVYTSNFGCQTLDPPLPQAYAKCVDETVTQNGQTYPVEANCEDRKPCFLFFDVFGAPYCASGAANSNTLKQTKISVPCFPSVDQS